MHVINGMIGGQEILLILLVILVLFGGRKIPELMRGLGKGVKEYKKAVNDIESDFSSKEDEKSEQKSPVSEEK